MKNLYGEEPDKNCKCCNGRGVQHNDKTGLNQPCPYCNGTGKKIKLNKPYYIQK
jgi:DnaJ-class molecular chaperone